MFTPPSLPVVGIRSYELFFLFKKITVFTMRPLSMVGHTAPAVVVCVEGGRV